MSYQKIPNLKKKNNRYYWIASGWARMFVDKTSYALGKNETKAIREALKINEKLKNKTSDVLEFGTNQYLFDYCQGLPWWVEKSKNRKKVITNWFNYLGKRTFSLDHQELEFRKVKFYDLTLKNVFKFYSNLTQINYENNTGNNLTSFKECFDIYEQIYEQCNNDEFFVDKGLKTNPFKFTRPRSGKIKYYATEDQLNKVIDFCREKQEWTIGLAFLITFYWQVRRIDIISRMFWYNIKFPNYVLLPFFKNHKQELQKKILYHKGISLYPEIENYLKDMPQTYKLSKYVITQKRYRKPYADKTFGEKTRRILNELGLSKLGLTFESFRKGGLTDLADSGATESEIQANSKHKNSQSLKPYIHKTHTQEISGQIKRLNKKQSKNK